MMQRVHSRFNALLSACVLSLIATAGWSQSITWLGTLCSDSSSAYGVSADGAVVVGWSGGRAFRWENGFIQDLGTPGGSESRAYGVSADGSVVVGVYMSQRAFRWQNGVMQDIIPGYRSWAYGVSANGAVVVGYFDASPGPRAFRWQNGVLQNLGTLPGYDRSYAYAVSADGAVVVGYAFNSVIGQSPRAFRWENGVMQDLGTLPGYNSSYAYGVSADGAVVVGAAQTVWYQYRAFRWENGVMRDLGTLGGRDSLAYGVSADGSVVVGSAQDAAGYYRAFRWTVDGGMEDLNTTYASLLTNGSRLVEARAISPDGRYIVGYGRNGATNRNEAFLLDTLYTPRCTALDGDVNGDGIVDDADLLIVLFNFGNRYR